MSVVWARVTVTGWVQGVSFRESTRARARELGVTGWVKNLPTGEVSGYFSGEEERVRELVQYVQQGPRLARVEHVEVSYSENGEPFSEFRVLR